MEPEKRDHVLAWCWCGGENLYFESLVFGEEKPKDGYSFYSGPGRWVRVKIEEVDDEYEGGSEKKA